MATFSELRDQVLALQGVVDAEQIEIANAIAALQAEIDSLNGLVADGGTAEERQAVIDNLTAIKEDLEGTIVPETPVE